jgi:hypothetical protein
MGELDGILPGKLLDRYSNEGGLENSSMEPGYLATCHGLVNPEDRDPIARLDLQSGGG